MLFLPYAYSHLRARHGEIPTEEAFREEVLGRVSIRGDQLTSENYRPGQSGWAELRNHLLAQTGLG